MMRVQYPQVAPGMALGFAVREAEPWSFASHRGGFYGCMTQLVLELNHELAVIVLSNGEPWRSGTPRQNQAFQNIIDRLFREAKRTAGIG